MEGKVAVQSMQRNKGDFPNGTMDKDPPANSGDRSLVQEDSTSHGATQPVCHSSRSPCTLGLVLCNKRSHHSENSVHRNDTVASTHCD